MIFEKYTLSKVYNGRQKTNYVKSCKWSTNVKTLSSIDSLLDFINYCSQRKHPMRVIGTLWTWSNLIVPKEGGYTVKLDGYFQTTPEWSDKSMPISPVNISTTFSLSVSHNELELFVAEHLANDVYTYVMNNTSNNFFHTYVYNA